MYGLWLMQQSPQSHPGPASFDLTGLPVWLLSTVKDSMMAFVDIFLYKTKPAIFIFPTTNVSLFLLQTPSSLHLVLLLISYHECEYVSVFSPVFSSKEWQF